MVSLHRSFIEGVIVLRKGSVDDLRSGQLTRSLGHIVLPMCHYPRGLKKTLIDEYIKALGPEKRLLEIFHAERDRLNGNHNAAFIKCDYQSQFSLNDTGVAALKRLTEISREQDVFLVCQCAQDQRCHRELLLICAKRWWDARTELRAFSYPVFEARLSDQEGVIISA